MSREDTNDVVEDDGNPTTKKRDNIDKNLKYSNLKATDIPTVQRLHEPKHGTVKQEIVMENTKQKLMACAQMYRDKHCNRKGVLKVDNLSDDERNGLKMIKKEIKDKKVVVFTTDKSGKFTVDTPENYNIAIQQHTQKDKNIDDDEKIKQVENKMNHHMKQFNKMFYVGKNHKQEDRIAGATLSTNVPAPPMYGVRKDHKKHDDKVKGPPVRPVCGASEAPNSRLSHFLSRIINDYADNANIETESKSSEEMRAAFEEYNGKDEETRKQCKVISMDVKALYPSMEWKEIVMAVREMVESSEKQIEDVDWFEVGKYLAVALTPEEIVREGLERQIPKRKTNPNRKVSVAYLTNKAYENNWY